MSTPDMTFATNELMQELRAMTPDELCVWVKLIRGGNAYAETCVHEAAHAVLANYLCVPFEYVTVRPTVTESGDLMAGHIRWKDIMQMTRDSSESYALAVIAPQVVLPLFGIERTVEEAQEEFSSDEVPLGIIMQFNTKLTHSSLLERVKSMMSNAVLLKIHRLAEELRDRKTLTSEDVRELLSA